MSELVSIQKKQAEEDYLDLEQKLEDIEERANKVRFVSDDAYSRLLKERRQVIHEKYEVGLTIIQYNRQLKQMQQAEKEYATMEVH